MGSEVIVGALASGGGTTIESIHGAITSKRLPRVRIGAVVTNKPDAGVIKRAREAGVLESDIFIIPRKRYGSDEEWGDSIIAAFKSRDVNFVGQYGWIPHTPANVVAKYEGRMVNQHPVSLCPSSRAANGERLDFGGPRMRGQTAVAAALYFAQMTDFLWYTRPCAHLVSNEVDGGEVVRSWVVKIEKDDTVKSLQERILPVEHMVQIATLGDYASYGNLIRMPRCAVVSEDQLPILRAAREKADRDYPNG